MSETRQLKGYEHLFETRSKGQWAYHMVKGQWGVCVALICSLVPQSIVRPYLLLNLMYMHPFPPSLLRFPMYRTPRPWLTCT